MSCHDRQRLNVASIDNSSDLKWPALGPCQQNPKSLVFTARCHGCSAVPLETAVGLEAVQQPLRERYSANDGDVPGIDAWITVFSSGMQMQVRGCACGWVWVWQGGPGRGGVGCDRGVAGQGVMGAVGRGVFGQGGYGA